MANAARCANDGACKRHRREIGPRNIISIIDLGACACCAIRPAGTIYIALREANIFPRALPWHLRRESTPSIRPRQARVSTCRQPALIPAMKLEWRLGNGNRFVWLAARQLILKEAREIYLCARNRENGSREARGDVMALVNILSLGNRYSYCALCGQLAYKVSNINEITQICVAYSRQRIFFVQRIARVGVASTLLARKATPSALARLNTVARRHVFIVSAAPPMPWRGRRPIVAAKMTILLASKEKKSWRNGGIARAVAWALRNCRRRRPGGAIGRGIKYQLDV